MEINVQVDPSTAGTFSVFGDKKVAMVTLVADDAYPAGGYTIEPWDNLAWDGRRIDWVICQPSVSGDFLATYDPENVKVKIFAVADGAEITVDDAEDEVFPLLVIGK